ncbi:hypothetical protein NL676_009723 [Syzygium grande]|nr:hypothetical protein NL676_009723 [Syzygium grande]
MTKGQPSFSKEFCQTPKLQAWKSIISFSVKSSTIPFSIPIQRPSTQCRGELKLKGEGELGLSGGLRQARSSGTGEVPESFALQILEVKSVRSGGSRGQQQLGKEVAHLRFFFFSYSTLIVDPTLLSPSSPSAAATATSHSRHRRPLAEPPARSLLLLLLFRHLPGLSFTAWFRFSTLGLAHLRSSLGRA